MLRIGLKRTVKGATAHGGHCVYTDADGGKLFAEWRGRSTAGGWAKGSGSLMGGTCKFAGMGDAVAYERIAVHPAVEGTFKGYTASRTSKGNCGKL